MTGKEGYGGASRVVESGEVEVEKEGEVVKGSFSGIFVITVSVTSILSDSPTRGLVGRKSAVVLCKFSSYKCLSDVAA